MMYVGIDDPTHGADLLLNPTTASESAWEIIGIGSAPRGYIERQPQ